MPHNLLILALSEACGPISRVWLPSTKSTVSDKSQFCKQPCRVDATMTPKAWVVSLNARDGQIGSDERNI